MYILLMVLHVIISLALVMIILAQSSKGGALDGLVGGTASSMLGSHGASEFLSKWTKIIGAIWMLSSLFLAINVRQMTAPERARALERLRRSETEEVDQMDTVFPADEEAPADAQPVPDEPVELEVTPVEPEPGTDDIE